MQQFLITKIQLAFLFVFFVFLFSCGSRSSSETHTNVDTKDDTKITAPVDNVAEVDPSLRVKEITAFASINFGISRQQYDSLVTTEAQEVVSYKYSFKPYFTELDQLYRLDLFSAQYDGWDTAVLKLSALELKIFQFYPTCEFANENFGIHNAISERMQISREWKIGNKKITTGIYTKDFDVNDTEHINDYKTVCKISNEGYLDSVPIFKNRRLDSEVKKSPERF